MDRISGDIVLRAAGPGTYLNELLGLVIAKHLTEQQYLAAHPEVLTTWIYLDDYAHWFDRRIPDLLFVAIAPTEDQTLHLYMTLLETKCVGQHSFAREAADAQQQVAQGVNRLMRAWAPGAVHLDASYWYQQLYQAIVGNLAVQREHLSLWETFRQHLPQGRFSLTMSGHAWVFCYDGAAGLSDHGEEGSATIVAPEAPGVPHHYHHYGRAGVHRLLRSLGEEQWRLDTPTHAWSFTPDAASAEAPAAAELPGTEFHDHRTEASAGHASIPAAEPVTPCAPVCTSVISADWLTRRTQELLKALRNQDIQVCPIETERPDIGPNIIRFKVQLRPGERLQRLQQRAADLQRELALETVPLIANVRGTRYVGIDLPHPAPTPVSLHTALPALTPASIGQLPFLVGQTPDGQVVKKDLADGLSHMLIAGSTGAGKTIFLYTFIAGLVHQFGAEALSLLLVDPKQTDFVYFEGLPHLLGGRVIIEPAEAIGWLTALLEAHLPERTQRLREARLRDLLAYNAQSPPTPMQPIVVVIDEYADLVQTLARQERQRFEEHLSRLAQRARNVGIHLVIATQRPTADIVTSKLKVNLPVRIAFRLPSHHDSLTILDHPGAEHLLGKGDMLCCTDAGQERLQGFYLSPAELEAILSARRPPHPSPSASASRVA